MIITSLFAKIFNFCNDIYCGCDRTKFFSQIQLFGQKLSFVPVLSEFLVILIKTNFIVLVRNFTQNIQFLSNPLIPFLIHLITVTSIQGSFVLSDVESYQGWIKERSTSSSLFGLFKKSKESLRVITNYFEKSQSRVISLDYRSLYKIEFAPLSSTQIILFSNFILAK